MNKKIAAIIGLIVIVVVVGYAVYKNQNKQAGMEVASSAQTDNTQAITVADATSQTPATATTANQQTAPTASERYALAVKTYKTRIQFNDCHGTAAGALATGKITIKKGVQVMLDNRDTDAHTFKMSSQTFHVAGYDFAIATAKDIGTYPITCDGGGGAQITVAP